MFPQPISSFGGDQEEPSLHELLNQCASNLTEKAAGGELSTAYARDQEIEQILTSLASPLKGRIVITGGARVGKTVVIHEVAARIQTGNCPEALQGSELWSLSARSILRAFGVQGWQDKLGRLMEKWVERPDVILYVDALPTTRMAGATVEDPFDMAQFLLGQLQSSSNRILAEGRTQAVQSFLEAYPEYKHILMEVKIPEPPVDVVRRMVAQASRDLEASQNTIIDEEAIEVAIDLTRRFALQESLPGKAIDLIGEGIALQSEQANANARVTKDDIIARFGEKTGLPRMLLSDDEPYDEQAVRRYFTDRVLGQEQAVDAVVQALSLLRTRLNNPYRPMGVFLFMGPTGVGKTELARALAEFLFGSHDVIVRFNMADYTADWHVQTLFGNPHGFDLESRRGLFTSRLQDHAFVVVLLDEFEKAHPEVFLHFLQLFDEGILLNGASETVNLRNSIVVLTSNFGTRMLNAGRLGFGPSISQEDQEQHIREEMDRFFSPELINRLDSVSFFKPLTKPVLREIAYRRVQEVLQREGLIRRQLDVEVDEDVIDWVVEHGYSERYGARYLARQIEKTITYPLAQQLIRNDPPSGSLLRLFEHRDRVASALVLPTTSHTVEEVIPPGAVTDARQLPHRLSLEYLGTGLPLLRERVEALEATHNIAEARTRLADLLQTMSTPAFWEEPQSLQPRLETLEQLSNQVDQVDRLRRNLDELTDLIEAWGGSKADDPNLLNEVALRYRYLVRELPRVELALLFGDPHDTYSAYLHIESQGKRAIARRWVADLGHMYLSWAERHEFQAATISEESTDEGLTRALWLRIEGYGAYGLLQGETGIHRLVQADPQSGKRQIVRASVSAWPGLPESELPDIDPERVTRQVTTLDHTGSFIEHLHTQVVVRLAGQGPSLRLAGSLPAEDLVQEAITLLRIQAACAAQPRHDPLKQTEKQPVRSYVRYKRNYVHDLRTGQKHDDFQAVLSGELDQFLESFLRQVVMSGPDATQ
jgi:ATP-dependent Clp protease ATP-binding subunit ClpC